VYPADRCESPFLVSPIGMAGALITAPKTCRRKSKFYVRLPMGSDDPEPYLYNEAWCCLQHRNTFLVLAGPESSLIETEEL
jgi:hypothetical protein